MTFFYCRLMNIKKLIPAAIFAIACSGCSETPNSEEGNTSQPVPSKTLEVLQSDNPKGLKEAVNIIRRFLLHLEINKKQHCFVSREGGECIPSYEGEVGELPEDSVTFHLTENRQALICVIKFKTKKVEIQDPENNGSFSGAPSGGDWLIQYCKEDIRSYATVILTESSK